MKPIKKRAVSGNNLAVAEGSSSSSDAVPVSKVNNNNDSVSSPNNPTSSTNDINKSTTTPHSQSSTQQPSNTTKSTTVPTKRSHKKRESTNNKTQQPLFAFNAASPLINDPNNPSSTSTSNGNASTIGIRPKRKLKQITRFNPYTNNSNHTHNTNVKCGEGFSCPRCNYVCSYDSKQCEECELECYYEAGVGVVTLKERRVSLVGTNSVKKVDRKTEVRKLSEMGKGIRRKSAPPAVSSTATAAAASNAKDVIEDKPGDLLLKQQSKDTTTANSNNTIAATSNTTISNTPNNNTQNNNIETKKAGGRPAKSRSSIINVDSLYQGAIINPLKCPHCSKDFLSEKGLQYHVGKF